MNQETKKTTKEVMSIETCDIIEVPSDYIECSVCGSWEPPSSYTSEEGGQRSRTNCFSCYHTSSDLYSEMKFKVKEKKRSIKYRNNLEECQKKKELFENSILVEDMISALKELPKGARLFIGQEGYYASGECADIFYPEKKKVIDNTAFFEIGYSSQNY
jgi:hypothetical protein